MAQTWKPSAYPSVSPYLVVEDGDAVIEFLTDAFDGAVARRYDTDDGSLLHGEVRIDDSIVMLGEASEEFPPMSSLVHLYVPDVDVAFDRAIDAGAEALEEPTEHDGDPDRRGVLRGPGGITWSVATQVAD